MTAQINYFTFNIDFLKNYYLLLKISLNLVAPVRTQTPLMVCGCRKVWEALLIASVYGFQTVSMKMVELLFYHHSSSKTLKICFASVV